MSMILLWSLVLNVFNENPLVLNIFHMVIHGESVAVVCFSFISFCLISRPKHYEIIKKRKVTSKKLQSI